MKQHLFLSTFGPCRRSPRVYCRGWVQTNQGIWIHLCTCYKCKYQTHTQTNIHRAQMNPGCWKELESVHFGTKIIDWNRKKNDFTKTWSCPKEENTSKLTDWNDRSFLVMKMRRVKDPVTLTNRAKDSLSLCGKCLDMCESEKKSTSRQ